jgi:hypothetical protein
MTFTCVESSRPWVGYLHQRNHRLSDYYPKKEACSYEMCRASLEVWFPRNLRAEMNQTWAGLGQIKKIVYLASAVRKGLWAAAGMAKMI